MQQDNLTQAYPTIDNEEEIDFKRLFFLIIRNWYWIPVSIAVGISVAFFYVKRQHQTYKAEATIMVPKSGDSFSFQQFFDKEFGGAGEVVANELEILKSYTLNNNVVQSLNWRVFWYSRSYMRWDGIYGKEPFTVTEEEGFKNPEGIFIDITPLDAISYSVKASGSAMVNGVSKDISFEATGSFGQLFTNEFFRFTLAYNGDVSGIKGNQYRFVFSNQHQLTRQYQQSLQVALTDRNSEVIRMVLTGTEPLREVHYLNQLISLYLDDKLRMQTQIQRQTLDFINQRLVGITDSLTEAGNVFNTFRSENQIFDLSLQGQMVMEQYNQLDQTIVSRQTELQYYNSLVDYLRTNGDPSALKSPSVAGVQDAMLNSLVFKLAELQTRRQMTTISSFENNPSLVRFDTEIEQVKKQLQENLDNLISNTNIAMRSLEKQKNEISQRISRLPEQEQKLINISRQYEITGNLYDIMLQKKAEFEIALASAVVNIQVIDRARIENITPTGMGAMMKYMIGALTALFLVLIIIFLKDFLDNKIHMPEDVERLTKIPVLGHVLHNTGNTELMVSESPTSTLAESVRSIRTKMSFLLTGLDDKVIGINSVRPNEGKTFICSNIATILAMNEKKTLLIGADMRKPRFSSVFNLPKDIGLSQYLSGQEDIEALIFSTNVPNLFVIPAGPLPPNPAELLDRERFNTFINWAKDNYDYIVIDNSPISLVTDGFITAKYCSLNLFILRNGVSRKDQVKFINDISNKGLMKNMALVINDVSPARFDNYYYSSYKYAYVKGY